jgi:hypothetical protein
MLQQLALAWVIIITFHWIWKRINGVPQYCTIEILIQKVTNGCENKPRYIPGLCTNC